MPAQTLATSGAISLAMAIVYAYVGHRLIRRTVAPRAREALQLFGTWWFAAAGLTFVAAARSFLAAAGITSLPVFVALTYVTFFLLSLALLGLVYYLVYLFTGRAAALPVVAAYYLVSFLVVAALITTAHPVGVEVGPWDTGLAFETELGSGVGQIVLLALLGPPIVGALAYLSLFFRVDGTTQRYRIGLVSTSIVLWFGATYGASLTGLGEAFWWEIASQLIGLFAALTILAAYLPPGWIRERFGIQRLGRTHRTGLRPQASASDG